MTDEQWWQPLFETGASAFYTGQYNAGREACESLLANPDLSADVREQTRRNAVFYAPRLASVVPSTRTFFVRFPVPEGWSLSNPSIAATPDGYALIVRSSNYRLEGWASYTVNDHTGTVRTANYLADLDASLACRRLALLNDTGLAGGVGSFPVHGFEDARLFRHRDAWHFTATARDRNQDGICQIALLRIDGTCLHDLRLLSDASTGIHEKNWMPVTDDDGHLRFVYGCSPTVILRYDDTTGTVNEERRHPAPAIARDFRGGSQLVPIDDGYLCLIHESIHFERNGHAYPHRFVRFDQDLAISHVSPMFFFLNRGTEFAAGLARQGDQLVASFGWWDREAVLATMPLTEVQAGLRPVTATPGPAMLPAAPFRAGPEIPPADPAATLELDPTDLPGSAELISLSEQTPALPSGFTPFTSQAPLSLMSVTISHNAGDLMADALNSVIDWVDRCLVIDTGITDLTLQAAREIAGDKLIVRPFTWCDDFAAARNFALDAAATLGATWAVMLDTDERLNPGPVDILALLATTRDSVLSVTAADGTYAKERFFRLPRRGRY